MRGKGKKSPKVVSKKAEYIYKTLVLVCAALFIFSFIYLWNIDNYHDWLPFLSCSVLTGFVFAIVINRIINHHWPEINRFRNPRGFKIKHTINFISVLLFPITVRFINEYESKSTVCKEYKIENMSCNKIKSHECFIYINGISGLERLSFGNEYNRAHFIGDWVPICVIKRQLGFRYYQLPEKP